LAKKRGDLYAVLGVDRTADAEAIKKAYRQLARKFHPDHNPGDKAAEERFKEVSEANDVLSDPEKRALYDEFGEMSLQAGFDPEAVRAAQRGFGGFRPGANFGDDEAGGGIPFEDLLGGIFGRARAGGRGMRGWPGEDLEIALELEFLEAAKGTTKHISITRPGPDGRPRSERVSVRIPPGVDDGGRIRVPGKGGEGQGGGPVGDLYARIRVRPHPYFKRDGRDLLLDLPVTVGEATLGARIEIPTLEGRAIVTVPAGSDSGRRLRLRAKGIADPKSGARGDLYATVEIRVPVGLDADAKELVGKLAAYDPPGIRKEWES
jgi:DnaJ-class molecular chaperone